MGEPVFELIREAVKEIQVGNRSAALAVLERTVASHPDSGDAWGIMGSLLSEVGDARATHCFREVIRIEPDRPDGHEQLISACYQAGLLTNALAAARDFSARFPRDANAIAMLGAMHEQGANQGLEGASHHEAIKAYEAALEIDPGHKLALKCLPGLKADEETQAMSNLISRLLAGDEPTRRCELHELQARGEEPLRTLLRLAFEEKGSVGLLGPTLEMAIWCGCALYPSQFRDYYRTRFRKGDSPDLDALRESAMSAGLAGTTPVHGLRDLGPAVSTPTVMTSPVASSQMATPGKEEPPVSQRSERKPWWKLW